MEVHWGDPWGLISSPPPSEPPSPFVLFSFFHFMRLFWNHILICRSVRQSAWAISIRLRLVKYLLKWNSFSNSRVWYRVYVCRPRFLSEKRTTFINNGNIENLILKFTVYSSWLLIITTTNGLNWFTDLLSPIGIIYFLQTFCSDLKTN